MRLTPGMLFMMAAEMLQREIIEPQRDFLLKTGWVPLGKNCSTHLEGWGKIIDGKAVTVDQPEALELAGYVPPKRAEGSL